MASDLLELWATTHLEQKIPSGIPRVCGKQLFSHLWQEITAEFPVFFPDLKQSRLFGVRLTYGFKLAKTGRRFSTLRWLILKALA